MPSARPRARPASDGRILGTPGHQGQVEALRTGVHQTRHPTPAPLGIRRGRGCALQGLLLFERGKRGGTSVTPVLTALAPGSAPGGADGGCVRRRPGTHTGPCADGNAFKRLGWRGRRFTNL